MSGTYNPLDEIARGGGIFTEEEARAVARVVVRGHWRLKGEERQRAEDGWVRALRRKDLPAREAGWWDRMSSPSARLAAMEGITADGQVVVDTPWGLCAGDLDIWLSGGRRPRPEPSSQDASS